MAIAAVAHIFVFSAEPYHFIPASGCGKVTTKANKAELKVTEGDQEKPAVLDRTEIQVVAPGTSVTESVQDIVLQGGQRVSSSQQQALCNILFVLEGFCIYIDL